jgi:hypothetical protein
VRTETEKGESGWLERTRLSAEGCEVGEDQACGATLIDVMQLSVHGVFRLHLGLNAWLYFLTRRAHT